MNNSSKIFWVERTDPFMASLLGRFICCNEQKFKQLQECNKQDYEDGSYPRFRILEWWS